MIIEQSLSKILKLTISITLLLSACSSDNSELNKDPLYKNQWHLKNSGQNGGTPGEDIDVEPVWDQGIKGKNITIAVIDDGMDINHEDLEKNIILSYNYDYYTDSSNTTGSGNCNLDYSGCHGTNVAGVSAAADYNGTGGRGVAPSASLVCFSLLGVFTSENQMDAMIRNKNNIDVSNNSWGPPDWTGELTPGDSLWLSGIEEGLETGRNSKGIIYVWAAGNGTEAYEYSFEEIDNSNYDGYANHYGVISVAAVNSNGQRLGFSEKGANIWVSSYSGITTTDKMGIEGYNTKNYYETFGGTSASAPVVTGIAALILEANPDLHWRDVKLILAESARKNDIDDSDWDTNNSDEEYNINHKYGFGIADAQGSVELAQNWTNVSEQIIHDSTTSTLNIPIPDNSTSGITDAILITSSGITDIEYVTIDINIDHRDSGELIIILTSPAGTTSILSERHNCYNEYNDVINCSFYKDGDTFTFGTARSLGEAPDGQWTIDVQDLGIGNTGNIIEWSLKIYGR